MTPTPDVLITMAIALVMEATEAIAEELPGTAHQALLEAAECLGRHDGDLTAEQAARYRLAIRAYDTKAKQMGYPPEDEADE